MPNFFNLIIFIFKDLTIISKIITNLFDYFYKLFTIELNRPKLDKDDEKIKDKLKEEEMEFYLGLGSKTVREYYALNFLKIDSFLSIDIIWSKIFGRKYLIKKNKVNLFRSYFRVLSTKNGFYLNFIKLKNFKNFNYLLINTFLSGFKFIWLGFRFWVFPLIVFLSIIYFTLVLRALPFNKIMFSWICILMFIYWLISGFVFFF